MRTTPSADGISLAFEVHGRGAPALVLVHGWSCDRSYWQGQVAVLSETFQVVTIDLAGHGASGLGRERWTMEAFGADVAAVADELGLENMVLVGHSMGGDVILEAARRLPGRVHGLIWLDTYRQLVGFGTREQLQGRLVPFRRDFVGRTRGFVRSMFPPKADPNLVERVANDMTAAPPEVALGSAESAWGFGPRAVEVLEELGLPVVAINPENPPSDIESLREHGVEVILMPGVGHFLMMEDPARVNRLLIEAVESIRRPDVE